MGGVGGAGVGGVGRSVIGNGACKNSYQSRLDFIGSQKLHPLPSPSHLFPTYHSNQPRHQQQSHHFSQSHSHASAMSPSSKFGVDNISANIKSNGFDPNSSSTNISVNGLVASSSSSEMMQSPKSESGMLRGGVRGRGVGGAESPRQRAQPFA